MSVRPRVTPVGPACALLLAALTAALAVAPGRVHAQPHPRTLPQREDSTASTQEYTILIYESAAQHAGPGELADRGRRVLERV